MPQLASANRVGGAHPWGRPEFPLASLAWVVRDSARPKSVGTVKEQAMKWTNLAVVGLALCAAGAGCLTRPVGQQPPTTKDNFLTTISQAQVDKVDILFAIDNSSSMGDKQAILADAVPLLITGL